MVLNFELRKLENVKSLKTRQSFIQMQTMIKCRVLDSGKKNVVRVGKIQTKKLLYFFSYFTFISCG